MADSPSVQVIPELGDDGQPQWAIHISAPLTTEAVAALCKTITLHGGILRAIAFVATVPSVGEEASTVKLSPQLQLKIQGPTLATEVLQETIASTLAPLL